METVAIPDRFIFMKVGMHAGEAFENILDRKRREFDATGMTFWGYGGSTCHPLSQVQPFIKASIAERKGTVHLLMETMDSKADPDLVPATEYSEDGIDWKELPSGIVVTGSRYAIVLGEISANDLELPLHEYAVALGKSEGLPGSDYINGRVDKACLSHVKPSVKPKKERRAKITHKAEVLKPYAVLLR